MPSTQSAYRQFHSTVTATVEVYNELLTKDKCLLDLTAAFHTIDHDLRPVARLPSGGA